MTPSRPRQSALAAFLAAVACWIDPTAAFTPFSRSLRTRAASSLATTALSYRNGTHHDKAVNNDDGLRARIDPNAVLTIPVLGPFPGQPPLMLGAEMALDPPTPWQWQIIEEAVWQHHKHLREEDDFYDASIDAAPLVAIMDSTTSLNRGMVGRYATIAAVVGMTTSVAGTAEGQHTKTLDMTDVRSFQKSLRLVGRDSVSPWESKVRLVGVGRATLRDFFYRIPSRHAADNVDEEGYVQKVKSSSPVIESCRNEDMDDDDEEEDDDEDDDLQMNLVMAHFQVVTDGLSSSKDFQQQGRGRRGANRAATASPVHALSEMANWARKMDYLHQDRRRLVAGLQAASARLEWAEQNRNDREDDLEDYDGLGMLTSRRDVPEEMEATQAAVEAILQTPPAIRDEGEESESKSPLTGMVNYGMGYSASSFSTLPQVTDVWLDKLSPYYSPQFRSTEEYHYEILSFVAVLSVDKIIEEHDIGWALHCTNTLERMQQAYGWMCRHVRILQEEAAVASAELRDCGEECTDLW
jgi:hypothetical protein